MGIEKHFRVAGGDIPAALAQKYVNDDQHMMQTGETLDTIEEHQLPDGHHLYVHVVKTPVKNAENEVVGVQGIFWDVTEQVRAEQDFNFGRSSGLRFGARTRTRSRASSRT